MVDMMNNSKMRLSVIVLTLFFKDTIKPSDNIAEDAESSLKSIGEVSFVLFNLKPLFQCLDKIKNLASPMVSLVHSTIKNFQFLFFLL